MFHPKTWLIVGGSGLLGHALARHLVARGQRVVAVHHRHPLEVDGVESAAVDMLAPGAADSLINSYDPAAVVYAAGLTDVDACEQHESLALRIHATAAADMARAANGRSYVYISTDHLWMGGQAFVREDTLPQPLNAYARTKLAGERAVLGAHSNALVVRTNFFGPSPSWRCSLSDWILRGLAAGQSLEAFDDVFFTPISSILLSALIERMVKSKAAGIFHLCGGERVSKYDFARRLAVAAGYAESIIRSKSVSSASLTAPRPRDMSLCAKKAESFLGQAMPRLDESFATLTNLTKP